MDASCADDGFGILFAVDCQPFSIRVHLEVNAYVGVAKTVPMPR